MRSKWLKEWGKNTKFFHGMASARNRANMICVLHDEGNWLQGLEKIIHIVMEFFKGLNSKEEWACSVMEPNFISTPPT